MSITTRQSTQINKRLSFMPGFDLGSELKTAHDKLDGIEAAADVTDATNVSAALDAGCAGKVAPSHIAGLANTASTVRARTVNQLAFSFVAADFGANDDLVVAVPSGHNILITDVTVLLTTVEGGACTATLRTAANGAGTAISSAFDLDATNGDVLRTTTLAGAAVAAGASLYLHASTNPGTTAGVLLIEYVHTT